ncbi:hypothetical protein KQI89_09825 [Clostridium sp. MSJ-4]|uniref:Uncharacterized protein n=1 Tax=Clostridium simiarum TaxID=2841506 RepID=A0ABS6F1E1_9CLOT|nr:MULTISPECIES: hypothetical protein [Clostridium]MBU5592068.1 hypothetical protein [Clostridium simiarum]
MQLLYNIYYKFNKEKVETSKKYLKLIKIDKVYDLIIKNCWKYSVQYEIVFKNQEVLEIMLYGRKKSTFLKFHITPIVFYEDYTHFLWKAHNMNCNKAYYINTGIFEKNILTNYNKDYWSRYVSLEDANKFIEKQIMMHPKHKPYLNIKYIDFCRYIPE